MKECIVLAGGFGTRLQSVVKDVPKCMAEVAGKPFLYYVMKHLERERFGHVILSLGYKHEIVEEWLNTTQFAFKISYVIESEPLGTGGAIKYAFTKVLSDRAFVINGDTFFDVNTDNIQELHLNKNADITIALKDMSDFDRYGSVDVNKNNRIVNFNEKQFCARGYINGGVYLIEKSVFAKCDLPTKFSFEKDVLEALLQQLNIYGVEQDSYFIDIGIPEDYELANRDFTILEENND